jgi:hypothetical protein
MLRGKQPDGLSKADLRRAKIARVFTAKPAARSAAHEGVSERPMDKNLSKSLAIKRAQKTGRGTSVFRIKTKEEEEQELEASRGTSAFRLNKSREDEEAEASSVAKLRPDRLQFSNLNLGKIKKPKKPLYGDL